MKAIITEDIIRNALNESIDEFMIEEAWGGFKGLWNNTKNGLGKVGRSLWNGAKLYMDYRTNGRWNQKYGYNPNFGIPNPDTFWGKSKELLVFNNWLNFHSQRLWTRLYNKDVDMNSGYNDRYDDNPASYIQKNITVELLKSYLAKYFRGYILPDNHPFFKYVNELRKEDPHEGLRRLSINIFLKSPEGIEYLNLKKLEDLKNQQQNDAQPKANLSSGRKKQDWKSYNQVDDIINGGTIDINNI